MDYKKLTKKQSGVIFLIVYIFTMGVGVVFVELFQSYFSAIWVMLIADVVMTIIIFLIGLFFKNASLYDPYWSVIPLYIVVLWIWVYQISLSINAVLLLLAITCWALRLTYNWWINWENFTTQDWRYDYLREKNPKLYPITNLFGIHMIPTIVVFIQMINVYDILQENTINGLFIVGLVFSIAAPIIQWFADKQMYEFRNRVDRTSKVINVGLWRFSRHPNYFGELLFWVGIYLMYFSYQVAIDINIVYPILMILLFITISIPMMENKLKDRYGYEKYKQTVSMIIPFFSKKNHH